MGGKIQTPDLYPLHPTPHTSSSPAPSSSSGPTHASSTLSEQIRMVRRGDFRLTVDVLPHPLYSPEEGGADLHASISISLDEALTGFQRDITGLDGSIRTVRYVHCNERALVLMPLRPKHNPRCPLFLIPTSSHVSSLHS